MYKIISIADGREIGKAENPHFIRKSSAGCYIQTDEENALGVSYRGTPYNLEGREGLDAPETVRLIECDAGEVSFRNTESIQAVNSTSAIAFVTMAEKGDIDDVTVGEHPELFSPWAFPAAYKTGDIRQYSGELYRCIRDHTSQEDWTPDSAVSLWVKIADPAEEWPEWSQPIGAHDAYQKGDKVTHNGKHWISAADANVWEPGVYGWEQADDE